MIQDRPYMRDRRQGSGTSVLTWLLSALVAMFIVQNVVRIPGVGLEVDRALALSPLDLRQGRIWELLTYGFVHSTSNLLQIISYVVIIFLTGREVLPVMGSRRFLGLFAAALAAGGLAFSAAHWNQPVSLTGASAGAAAMVVLYACFYPERETTFLVFFVLPVTLRPRTLALALVAADLCGLVLYELLRMPFPFYAAHSAHLGGMAAAWVYYRYFHDVGWGGRGARSDIELPKWLKRREASAAARKEPAFSVNVGDKANLRAEVDRILDKINSHGFASLTDAERRMLDEAKDLIGRG